MNLAPVDRTVGSCNGTVANVPWQGVGTLTPDPPPE